MISPEVERNPLGDEREREKWIRTETLDPVWEPDWVLGSMILTAYFELIYERNPRVFSKSGSKVYWWVSFDQTLNLPTGYIEIKVVGFF